MSYFKTIFFLTVSFLIAGCNNAQQATYILPKGYKGIFAVVYIKNGKAKLPSDSLPFYEIPENGIYITNHEFKGGERNDLFLIRSEAGFDTVKYFIANSIFQGNEFDHKFYTNDTSALAINTRQIVNVTYSGGCSDSKKPKGQCHFVYELITAASVDNLKKQQYLASFTNQVDSYLREKYCCK